MNSSNSHTSNCVSNCVSKCFCLNDAEHTIFTDHDGRCWGLCRGHYERWRYRHPLIYVDGIGVAMLEHMQDVYRHAHQTSAPWLSAVFYFPCVFSGEGTYTERQRETLMVMQHHYETGLFNGRINGGRPHIVFNSPVYNMLMLPIAERSLCYRHALRYMLRPAVWLLYTDGLRDTERLVKQILGSAAQMTPTTWIHIAPKPKTTRRNAWHIWNTAMHYWNRQYQLMQKTINVENNKG